MSSSLHVVSAVYRRTGTAGIHVDALNALAVSMGLPWPGQNGGLFGRRQPYLEARGDMRYPTDYALRRLGVR